MKIQTLTYRTALESPAYKVHGLEVISLTTVKLSKELESSSPTRTRIFAVLSHNWDTFVIEEISKDFKKLRVQPDLYDRVFDFSEDARSALFSYLDKKYHA